MSTNKGIQLMKQASLTRLAVRLTLAAAAAAVVPSTPAMAQTASVLDEVVVTGSRIVRKDYEATSPVVTVSAEVFALSGEPQIEKVLNEMPQLVPSVTTTSNNPSNGGQANVDLRGLGTARTLVLMDGLRLTPSNVTGVVDLNTIPGALIESVEILTGGASSTYGSDAIAGVVNFRMKRSFEGVEATASYGITGEDDGETNAVSLTMGSNFADNRGNAVVSMSYDSREAVLAGDRKFGEVTFGADLTPTGSGTVPDGAVSWGSNAPTQAALDTVFATYGAAAGTVPTSATIGFNTDGTLFSFGRGTAAQPVVNYRGDTDDAGFNPQSYSYNFGPINYLQLPLERKQFAAFLRYDLVPDQVEMYSRAMFTSYSADQQLAATPISSGVGTSVPVTNSQIPAGLRALLLTRTNPTANFTMGKRTVEVGPRYQDNSYDVVQGVVGVKGVLPNDWQWDVSGSWGQMKQVNVQAGNVSRSRYNAALINPAVYASQGCAAFNPFGVGNITPACAAAVAIRATNVTKTDTTGAIASLTGSLFDMPAGPLQFAAGVEYRRNVAKFSPDEFLASGDVVGFNAQQPVAGSTAATEGFVELSVPLLSEKPFANYLGLDLGYRYSDYNLAGGVDTYKMAMQWRPVESLQVRASYNRAIRAPNVNELFLPQQENFPTYTDPCNATGRYRTGSDAAAVTALCQAQGIPANVLVDYQQAFTQARAFVGGNIELTPETADTYTFGVAWQSSFDAPLLRNLSASVDYYKYEIEDQISFLSVNSIMGRCFNDLGANPTFDINNLFCQLFDRDDTFRPDGVMTTNLNLAATKHEGVDIQVDWGVPLGERFGDLKFHLLWTHLIDKADQETVTDAFYSYDGTISQTIGSANPSDKAVLTTTWGWREFTFRYNLRYIGSMDVVNNNAQKTRATRGLAPSVSSYTYHDLSARYSYNDKYSVTLGVNNIADKQPPIYTTDSRAGIQSNTDPSTFDVLGRRYFLNVGAKF